MLARKSGHLVVALALPHTGLLRSWTFISMRPREGVCTELSGKPFQFPRCFSFLCLQFLTLTSPHCSRQSSWALAVSRLLIAVSNRTHI